MAKKNSDIFDYLISNRRFIDWVKNPNETSDYFWKKWLDENADCDKDFEDARGFVKGLKFKDEELSNSDLDALLGGIIKEEKTRVLREGNSKRKFSLNFDWLFKVAVLILIVGIASLIPYYLDSRSKVTNTISEIEWEVITNPIGKKSKVVLPDGTRVVLNRESTLKYPKKFKHDVRRVELYGEAFFDVRHIENYPFIVKTGVLETQVFGTTFNINSFPHNNTLDISLVTGKVEVHNTEEAKSIALRPGEQLSFNKIDHKMVKRKFDVENTIAWQYGYIIFEDVGFKEFVDRLERWYGVNFQIYGTPPQDWKFNGRYHNADIEDILIGIKFVYKLDYNIQGNNIIIKFN